VPAGDLTNIVVPDERDEAMRDLSRARKDAVATRLRVCQQMKATFAPVEGRKS
jgi:transposase